MINTKYEVDRTLQLGYLEVKKSLIFENHENATRDPRFSENFRPVFPQKLALFDE